MSTLKVNTLQNTSGTTLNLVKQIVQGSTTTTVEVASTTYADTGLTASITPSSTSSKILVLINQDIQLRTTGSFQGLGIRIYRGSTLILDPIADSTGPYDVYLNDNLYSRWNFSLLDSPATTSSVTYKTQGRPYTAASSGKAIFQTGGSGTVGTSYIQLIEVAA